MFRVLFLFACILCSKIFSQTPPAPMQNFLPVVLVNNTGLTQPSHPIYLVITALDPNGITCFLVPNTTTGICSYVYPKPGGNPSSVDASVILTSLPVAQVPTTIAAAGNAFLIYLPVDISTRAYFSVDRPLYLETSFTAGDMMIDISGPSFNYSDPNTYTLYQFCEFNIAGSEKPVDSSLLTNGDISYVDLFCLPMSLAQYSYPSNALVTENPGGLPSGLIPSLSRKEMLGIMANAMVGSGNPSWQSLVVNYYPDPYSTYIYPYPAMTSSCSSGASTYSQVVPVRYLAAKNSMGITSLPGGAPPTPSGCLPMFSNFSPDYASSAYNNGGTTPTTSYFQSLYNYYNITGNKLYFTCIPPNLPICTYEITSDATTNLQLLFTPQTANFPTLKLLLENDTLPTGTSNGGLTTEELFSGSSGWPFTSSIATFDNADLGTQIAQVISALFGSGNLPLQYPTGAGSTSCPNPPLGAFPTCTTWIGGSCPFPDSNCGFNYLTYFNNPPTSFASQGIWYNLYAQIIHEQESGSAQNPILISGTNTPLCPNGCVPNNPTLGLGYAYDYDDLLNMSGLCTLTVQDAYANPAAASGTNPAAPYLVFTLGKVETDTIPTLFQTQNYNGVPTTYQVATSTSVMGGATVTYSYYSAAGGQVKTATAPVAGANSTATTLTPLLDGGVYATATTPFLMTFSFTSGSYSYSRTFQIDLQHQVAVPYTSGTAYPQTSFNYIDATYQSGISFVVTRGTSGVPSFVINFNSEIPPWPAGAD